MKLVVVRSNVWEKPRRWKAVVACGTRNPTRKIRLDNCDTTFVAGFNDLFVAHWEVEGVKHHYAAVDCPHCHKTLPVTVPGNVWYALQWDESTGQRKKSKFDGCNEPNW